ncbi:hypothetical protein D3C77_237450 [compost metagenome]
MRHNGTHAFTQRPLRQRARHGSVDDGAAYIQQIVVLHPRRAGGFAIAAAQAAVQVQLGLGGDFIALQHLLDQVNAPARAVELVANQLVRRARGIAEAAMHTAAQDAFGFLGTRQLPGLFTQMGLHGYTSLYMRPGLKMPWGSS